MKKSLSFFILPLVAFAWPTAAQAQSDYKLSTESEQHWYYIVNQGNNNYSKGKVMSCEGNGVKVAFTTHHLALTVIVVTVRAR